MNHSGLHLPAHCTPLSQQDLSTVNGGGSILSFISYLLSGFSINFGSGNNHDNYDTVVTTDGRPGWGGTSHSNVDTVHSSSYGGWDASFNLGSFFNALLRLFN